MIARLSHIDHPWFLPNSSQVLIAIFFLPNIIAGAVIQPGQLAPEFTAVDMAGEKHGLNGDAPGPWLLVFVKADDRYTSSALAALDHLLAIQSDLVRDLQYWVIISRTKSADLTGHLPPWAKRRKIGTLLVDQEDHIYQVYRVIATPTVVLVSRSRRVISVQPGYDAGMEQRIRLALAGEQGITLSAAEATGKAPPPNMTLQMGRQLASRKLWERALPYYERANAQSPLNPPALLEMAKIHLELQNPGQALAILNKLPADPALARSADQLRTRALKLERAKAFTSRNDGATTPSATRSVP